MNILLSGARGLIGSCLTTSLTAEGHRVIPLARSHSGLAQGVPTWNPAAGEIDLRPAGPFEAVIHLAGETIAQRWTPAAKARIRGSRLQGTRLLAETVAALPQPPEVMICASAVGFYGHRGDEVLDESSGPGQGFLAETCRAWEEAAAPAVARGLRVVNLRLGLVLTPRGGALARMLPPFRLGLGGRLGDGRHYWSWLSLDDLPNVVLHALRDRGLHGPLNAVSPNAVTNDQFTRALARVLQRPALFPVPRWAIRLAFGEMGLEALLASTRVRPARLETSGFVFRHTELGPALETMLGR